MAGFFDPVIATGLRNLTTGTLETAETLRSNVVHLPQTQEIEIFSIDHTINTDGPSGWTDAGTYHVTTFDTSAYANIPATVKHLVLELIVAVDYLTTQPANTVNLCRLGVRNDDATFGTGDGLGMVFAQAQMVANATVPSNYVETNRTVIVPCSSGKRILRFVGSWPNLAIALSTTWVICRVVGYIA
jgi:hypothetical protein